MAHAMNRPGPDVTDYDRPVLHGRDAMVFDLLAQAAAILRRKGVPEPEALIWRVADEHLPHPRPEPVPFIVQAQARRTVDLTPLQLSVLTIVTTGATHGEVGQRLGLTPRAVLGHMQRIARAMGVRTGTQAVALVLGGQVQVRRKQGKRAA